MALSPAGAAGPDACASRAANNTYFTPTAIMSTDPQSFSAPPVDQPALRPWAPREMRLEPVSFSQAHAGLGRARPNCPRRPWLPAARAVARPRALPAAVPAPGRAEVPAQEPRAVKSPWSARAPGSGE